MNRRLGTDLGLTRYVGTPARVPLEVADSWGTVDLAVRVGGRGGLRAKAKPGAKAAKSGDAVRDLVPVAGRENLGQALILRLLTARGSLAPLGHPSYGSRLVELVGELNDASTRNLARLYTLEALQAEPRVAEVLDLRVEVSPDQPDVIRIDFAVRPVTDDPELALSLEVTL